VAGFARLPQARRSCLRSGYGQPSQPSISKADITITLLDLWVYDPTAFDPRVRFVPWFPVDQEPIPAVIAEKAKAELCLYCLSKFALAQCRNAGIEAYYVPHGVDTAIFKPCPRPEARERLEWNNDWFIFGLVADNKGVPLNRKAFSQQIEAFARFHKLHPDSRFTCTPT
jgi:hypothetical protein